MAQFISSSGDRRLWFFVCSLFKLLFPLEEEILMILFIWTSITFFSGSSLQLTACNSWNWRSGKCNLKSFHTSLFYVIRISVRLLKSLLYSFFNWWGLTKTGLVWEVKHSCLYLENYGILNSNLSNIFPILKSSNLYFSVILWNHDCNWFLLLAETAVISGSRN